MSCEELIEVKFRLADGSDIGPNRYSPATTVGSLKQMILSQLPQGLFYFYIQTFYLGLCHIIYFNSDFYLNVTAICVI